MLEEMNNMLRDKVLAYIERADDFEIREIMGAVERRFSVLNPDWSVIYAAVHKDPALRKKDLADLVAYIEKDLKWNEEKKDSLALRESKYVMG